MAYYLHLFRVAKDDAPPSGTPATRVPVWIRANATPVGEMEFGAGRATYVLVVLTQLCGVDLAPLQEGPWKEWESADLDIGFGGLSHGDAIKAMHGLRAVAASPEKQAHMSQLAVTWGLKDEKMLERCTKMADLLEKCIVDGGEVVALYQ